MSRIRTTLLLLAVLVVAVLTTSCVDLSSRMTYSNLKGAWYLTSTGGRYDFVSETRLVLPSVQADGGNSIPYEILDDDKLALNYGKSTQVVEIVRLSRDELVIGDLAGGPERTLLRDLSQTMWAKDRDRIEKGALAALRRFPDIEPKPAIIWLEEPPSGDIQPWPLWPTSGIARYRDAWEWASIKRATGELKSQGTGEYAGYSVSFVRPVPTQAEITASSLKTGQKIEAGGPLIEVGYSASKAEYPAGTVFFVGGRLLYSLGDGYGIGLKVGADENEGFIPETRNQ